MKERGKRSVAYVEGILNDPTFKLDSRTAVQRPTKLRAGERASDRASDPYAHLIHRGGEPPDHCADCARRAAEKGKSA